MALVSSSLLVTTMPRDNKTPSSSSSSSSNPYPSHFRHIDSQPSQQPPSPPQQQQQQQQPKKKHVCPTCDRAFTTSGHLARHTRVHTGERNHKCPFPGCETRCSRQDNLQQQYVFFSPCVFPFASCSNLSLSSYRIHLSPGSRRSNSATTRAEMRLVPAPLYFNRSKTTQGYGLHRQGTTSGKTNRETGSENASPNGVGPGSGIGEQVDVLMWLNYLTFDVISDLAFGEPLGMLDRETDVLVEDAKLAGTSKPSGVAAMIDFRGRTAAFLGLFPALLPGSIFEPLARLIPDPFVQRGLQGTDVRSFSPCPRSPCGLMS